MGISGRLKNAVTIILLATLCAVAGAAEDGMSISEPPTDDDRGGKATRYKMRQNLISFGDDFWIEDDKGKRVFKVDGKMLRVRDTLFFEDRKGNPYCKIQGRIARIKDTIEVEDNHGDRMALVQKALITPLRDRWTVKIDDGPNLEVQGDILNHEYTIGEGRHKVADISKKWFRIRDTYGVQIKPGQDELLILAITVAVDMMAHD